MTTAGCDRTVLQQGRVWKLTWPKWIQGNPVHWKEWKPYLDEFQEEMVRAENWYEEEQIDWGYTGEDVGNHDRDAYDYMMEEAIS